MATIKKRPFRPLSHALHLPRVLAGLLLASVFHSTVHAADSAAEPVTHLFTGWYGIDAGDTVFKVNRQNVDDESLAVIEEVKDYYRIVLADGPTAPERVLVPSGIRIQAEVAQKSQPWLVADKPWETGGVALQRIIHVDGVYRVWYSASVLAKDKVIISPINGRKKLGNDGSGFSGLCYMESRDGVHWTKPSLGLVEFRGSMDNNIISTDPLLGPAIFLDEAAPPEERYKSVSNRRIREFDPSAPKDGPALGGAVSPDGLRWKVLTRAITDWKGATLAHDGSPEVHRDSQTGNYVLYTRANYPRRRSIARAETSDFYQWPLPSLILTPGPDDDPSVDYYNNPYMKYPAPGSTHLLLVSSYHRDTSEVDVRMASSMDGDAWNWLRPRTVIELGKEGEWDSGSIYVMSDMVRLPDGRVAVGYIGKPSRHNEYWRTKYERGRSKGFQGAWAYWEDGRIAGVVADKVGEFTTLPMQATGRPIEINARTGKSGSIRVEVLVDGRPFPEVVLRGKAMTGDLRWNALEFEDGTIESLAGRTIRLRFHLYDATVFGVRGDGLEWVSFYPRK